MSGSKRRPHRPWRRWDHDTSLRKRIHRDDPPNGEWLGTSEPFTFGVSPYTGPPLARHDKGVDNGDEEE